MFIESINVGRVVTDGDPDTNDVTRRQWTSAFAKQPVAGRVRVLGDRLEGDQVGNPAAHGGVDKAILCYPAAHHHQWSSEFPHLVFGPGAMGENLTLDGCDETNVCIGDRYAAGDVVLEVSQPRGPCWKIDRHHGHAGVLKRVTATGRTGWYVRVVQTGTLRAGQTMSLVDRVHPDWPVTRALEVLFGREKEADVRRELQRLPGLADAFKATIG